MKVAEVVVELETVFGDAGAGGRIGGLFIVVLTKSLPAIWRGHRRCFGEGIAVGLVPAHFLRAPSARVQTCIDI